MISATAGYRRNGGFAGLATSTALLTVVLSLCVLVVYRTPSPTVTSFLALAGFVCVGGWMFLSERYELTLAALLLYLLLLDGFLKLKTGSQVATLGRDILLYAIVAGAVVRWVQRRQGIHLPPLSGWVIAFAAIVLVCMFNPGSYPALHAVASVRPHLEFVVLFFFGFHVMRNSSRLRWFALLLLVGGAANGVVNIVQFNLEPEQLASWGPGYRTFIEGSGGLAGRTFTSESGDRVRPFGLAGDAGGGGTIGALAIPSGLALIAMARRRTRYAVVALLLTAGSVAAVLTSQGRGVVVACFVIVVAYAVLATSPRRVVPTVATLCVAMALTMLVVNAVSGGDASSFERYDSIAPGALLTTTQESRGGALSVVPDYIARFPLGHGLGTGGPATGFGRSADDQPQPEGLSAESEYSFLVLEMGVPGLVTVVGFVLVLLGLSVTRVRRVEDPEERALLAAVLSPLFGLFALFVGGPATTSSPLAPYLWFSAGIIAYWLIAAQAVRRNGALPPVTAVPDSPPTEPSASSTYSWSVLEPSSREHAARHGDEERGHRWDSRP